MNRIVHISLFCLLGLLFVAPVIQRGFNLFEQLPLSGWHQKVHHPKLTLKSWLSGDYQKEFDKHVADSFGFTPSLVRSINQIDFNLFNSANAQYVVVGKDNYLYESAYIDAVTGQDFVGLETIRENCEKLSVIQQGLLKRGVRLVVVLAPGKGSYFPEFIPKYYNRYFRDSTNFRVYKNELMANSVATLDFNTWFISMKDTSRYELYPKTGIHWSTYGMLLAGDSLRRYMEHACQAELPSYNLTFDKASSKMLKSDDDIEKGMNLWRDIPDNAMIYPSVSFDTHGTTKLSSAVIADSYFWGLFDHGFSSRVCTSGEFWYYFNEVYPQNFENGLTIDQLDLKASLEKHDVIVLMATDATLPKLGWGFIDKAYKIYLTE